MLEKVKSILDCLEMTFGICLISKLTKLEKTEIFNLHQLFIFSKFWKEEKNISDFRTWKWRVLTSLINYECLQFKLEIAD
jgi:hypothetical protein